MGTKIKINMIFPNEKRDTKFGVKYKTKVLADEADYEYWSVQPDPMLDTAHKGHVLDVLLSTKPPQTKNGRTQLTISKILGLDTTTASSGDAIAKYNPGERSAKRTTNDNPTQSPPIPPLPESLSLIQLQGMMKEALVIVAKAYHVNEKDVGVSDPVVPVILNGLLAIQSQRFKVAQTLRIEYNDKLKMNAYGR